MAATYSPPSPKNSLALISLISSLLGWLFFLIMLCLNYIIVPMIAVATLGLGLLIYLCLIPLCFVSPLAWLVGVITGHTSLSQMRISRESGEGSAKAGLILGWIGLALTILGLCAIIGLIIAGGSIPILDEIMRTW
jgi:hypothetical protein